MNHRFGTLTSQILPIDRANVDTDAILPKQFLKSVRRTGFGDNLFDEWRYLDPGQPGQPCATRPRNGNCPLNLARYQGAQILLARANFGCGSSREHAVWALRDWGIRALIAPSFADIFRGNCYKNGMLPITLPAELVDSLFLACAAEGAYLVTVDLAAQALQLPSGEISRFPIDDFRKHCLLSGQDEIALTLANEAALVDYEKERATLEPWLFREC